MLHKYFFEVLKLFPVKNKIQEMGNLIIHQSSYASTSFKISTITYISSVSEASHSLWVSHNNYNLAREVNALSIHVN